MRILFGHQSVGQNILQGIAELEQDGRTVPRVVAAEFGGDTDAPIVVAQFRVGINGNPLSKLTDFAGKVTGRLGCTARAALFKFCYVDVRDNEVVVPLFDAYVETMRRLQDARPDLVIAHMTVPLRVVRPDIVLAGLRLLRRSDPQLAQNAARHELNERLRHRYAAGGPFFDLAAIESAGRAAPPALDRRLTDDGGHLNARGRQLVACEFIEFLQKLLNGCD